MSVARSASSVPAVVGLLALATTTLCVIGAALVGTTYEFAVSIVALVFVVGALWRWVR